MTIEQITAFWNDLRMVAKLNGDKAEYNQIGNTVYFSVNGEAYKEVEITG